MASADRVREERDADEDEDYPSDARLPAERISGDQGGDDGSDDEDGGSDESGGSEDEDEE